VLDHLIVQKMDDTEAGADVQSILTYGAKTLFEEDDKARDIGCEYSLRFCQAAIQPPL
jgi:chromodomain-helicase-DNA-binding protein 4